MIDNIQVGIHDSGNILGPSISIRGIRRSQLIFLTVDVEEIHEKADTYKHKKFFKNYD